MRQKVLTIVFIVLLPAILPIAILYLGVVVVWGFVLHLLVWLIWVPQGIHGVFVYSDSTIWKEDIETTIFPRLGRRFIILNWSERRQWRTLGLAEMCFQAFRPRFAFNPMVLIFKPGRMVQKISFYDAYKKAKLGKEADLTVIKSELLDQYGQ